MFASDKFAGGTRDVKSNSGGRRIQRRSVRSSVYFARRFTARRRSERSIAELADAIAEIIELVVFDRPLLRARPVVDDWVCHHRRTAHYARAKPGAGTRSARGTYPNDSHRLDLRAR